jgi:hypothetical protein
MVRSVNSSSVCSISDENIVAVHYTHATATFAASFLLRLARLLYALTFLSPLAVADTICSPNECNLNDIREQVETLASLMSESEICHTERSSISTDTIVASSG